MDFSNIGLTQSSAVQPLKNLYSQNNPYPQQSQLPQQYPNTGGLYQSHVVSGHSHLQQQPYGQQYPPSHNAHLYQPQTQSTYSSNSSFNSQLSQSTFISSTQSVISQPVISQQPLYSLTADQQLQLNEFRRKAQDLWNRLYSVRSFIFKNEVAVFLNELRNIVGPYQSKFIDEQDLDFYFNQNRVQRVTLDNVLERLSQQQAKQLSATTQHTHTHLPVVHTHLPVVHNAYDFNSWTAPSSWGLNLTTEHESVFREQRRIAHEVWSHVYPGREFIYINEVEPLLVTLKGRIDGRFATYLNYSELVQFIQEFDHDKDGKITFTEFADGLCRQIGRYQTNWTTATTTHHHQQQRVIGHEVRGIHQRSIKFDRVVELTPIYIEIPVYSTIEKAVYLDKLIEKPVPKERIVEREVRIGKKEIKLIEREVPRHIQNYVDVEVEEEIEVPVEKITERPVYIEKVIEKPVQQIRRVKRKIPRQVPVEKIIERIIDRPVYVKKYVEVEEEIEVPIEKVTEKPVYIEKVVRKPVEQERQIIEYIENIVYQDEEVIRPLKTVTEKIVYKDFEEEVEVLIENVKEKPVYLERIVEDPIYIVERPRYVDVPGVERIIENRIPKIVERVIERPLPRQVFVKQIQKHIYLERPEIKVIEKQIYQEKIVEVPYFIDKFVDKFIDEPYIVEEFVDRYVDVIHEVKVPVKKPIYIEREYEKIVEKQIFVETIKEVPVFIDQYEDELEYEDVYVDVIRYNDVYRDVEIPQQEIVRVPIYVEKVVEKIVEKQIYIERVIEEPIYIGDRVVKQYVDKVIKVPKYRDVIEEEVVEVIVPRKNTIYIEKVVDKIIEKQVYTDKKVKKEVIVTDAPIGVPQDKIRYVDVTVERPIYVDRVVDVEVEQYHDIIKDVYVDHEIPLEREIVVERPSEEECKRILYELEHPEHEDKVINMMRASQFLPTQQKDPSKYAWQGYYILNGKNDIDLNVHFEHHEITGHGIDKMGKFTLKGTIGEDHTVTIDKIHEFDLTVQYKGTINHERTEITGTWEISGYGGEEFKLWRK